MVPRCSLGLTLLEDDATVDIDTYDVSESKTLRDCLTWEAASNQPSPTDSTSTTNSGAYAASRATSSGPRMWLGGGGGVSRGGAVGAVC